MMKLISLSRRQLFWISAIIPGTILYFIIALNGLDDVMDPLLQEMVAHEGVQLCINASGEISGFLLTEKSTTNTLEKLSKLKGINIRILEIHGSKLTQRGFRIIADLPSLDVLRISRVNLEKSDVELLKESRTIGILSIRHGDVPKSIFPAIYSMTTIRNLTLGDLSVDSEPEFFLDFRGMYNLTDLSIESVPFHEHGRSDEPRLASGSPGNTEGLESGIRGKADIDHGVPFRVPKCLQTLSVSNTNFDDACIKDLTNCNRLEFLDVSYTRVTKEGLKHLFDLSNLRTLFVKGLEIQDDKDMLDIFKNNNVNVVLGR